LGKTRLVYEFELANAQRACFIHGACSAISPSPLNLFTSICETLFRTQLNESPELKKQKLEQGYGNILKSATSEERKVLLDNKALIAFLLEIKSADERLKQTGADLLAHLSLAIEVLIQAQINAALRENKPLVMVLDDLHWLDEASARVLENLLNKIANAPKLPPIMLILMFRLEYNIPPYISVLAQVNELELKAFNADNIRKMIANHTQDKELSENTIENVVHLSQGNPFFLEEWCNYIEELPQEELKDFPVPTNLQTLILSRLDKLPPALRMLLHKASVIGQEFFVDILRYMESQLHDPIDIDATLRTLVDQSLILQMLGFEYSTYFFKHITTREVAYQTLLLENRKLLHQLCGQAIEELHRDRLEEFHFVLAEHYSKAENVEKAIYYLEKSALSAARVYNNQQALHLYGKMLEITALPILMRLEIKLKIADIMWLTGDWKTALPEVQSVLAESEKLDAKACCFEAHRFLGIAAFYMGDPDKSYAEFSEALNLAKGMDDPALMAIATGNMGNWYFQTRQFDQAKSMHQQSLDLAMDTNDVQRQAKTLSNLGMICLEENDLALAEEYFTQSLKLAVQHRLMKEQSIALGNLGWTKMLDEDYEAALPLLQQKLKLAEAMNDKMELIKVLGNIGNLKLELGDKESGKESYQRILELREYLGDEKGAENVREYLNSIETEA